MINESQHPDQTALNSYALRPEAEEFIPLSLHLAQCRQCRDEFDMSQRIRTEFVALPREKISEDQQQIVNEFLYAGTDSARKAKLRQQIRQQPEMMKSALYSLAQQIPDKVAAKETGAASVSPSRRSWFNLFLTWLQWRSPVWVTAGVTAVLVVSLSLLLFNLPGDDGIGASEIGVASYRDDASIRFFPRNHPPGIGFFSGAMQSTQPFPGVRVALRGERQLVVNWPAVPQASGYRLELYRHAEGGKTLVSSSESTTPGAIIDIRSEDYDHRLEWILSGDTRDDRSFVSAGGFIVHRIQRDMD